MRKFRLFLSIIFRWWRYALLNIIFNLLSAVFSIFSLTMVIPFLQVLFGTTRMVTAPPSGGLSKDYLMDGLNYLVSKLIIAGGKEGALLLICAFVLVMFLLKNLTQYMGLYFLTPVRTGVVKEIRDRLYHKLLILPLSYYSESRRGDILSRCSNDVQEVENAIMRSFELLFREPLTILLFLITLFTISFKLTLISLLLLPVGGIIIGLLSRALRRQSARSQQQLGQLMSTTEETIAGIRVIKAFNAIRLAADQFRKMNQSLTRLMMGVSRRGDLASPLSEFLGASILVLLLLYGGNLVLKGGDQLGAEAFIAFLVIFSQLINPAKNLSTAFSQLQRGAASFERINQVLDAEELILEKEEARPIHCFNSAITLDDVSFRYEDSDVLINVSIRIPKGSITALVGPSGGGKSTLADLLPRFFDVQHGRILIDGHDIRDLRIDDLRLLFGIVTQESILFNDTVFNNISFGYNGVSEEQVIAAARQANAHEFIEAMPAGYFTPVGDRGANLSVGQRQRITIARAILRNPPILIFDEATSALDTESERLVQEALDKLLPGRTSLIIAHRFSTIQKADNIIVIDKGRIIESGTHRELMQLNGLYKKLHDLQSLA